MGYPFLHPIKSSVVFFIISHLSIILQILYSLFISYLKVKEVVARGDIFWILFFDSVELMKSSWMVQYCL